MDMITVSELYDLKETIAAELLETATYPWEVLPKIHDFIICLGKSLPADMYEERGRTSGWRRARR